MFGQVPLNSEQAKEEEENVVSVCKLVADNDDDDDGDEDGGDDGGDDDGDDETVVLFSFFLCLSPCVLYHRRFTIMSFSLWFVKERCLYSPSFVSCFITSAMALLERKWQRSVDVL